MKKMIVTVCCFTLSTMLFAEGYYLEFKISSKGETMSGKMKTYFQDDNTRMEIAAANLNMVTLMLKNNLSVVYLLNETDKTYSELSLSNAEDYKDYPQSEYEVAVIGKEKVNGYNSTHVSVKTKLQKPIEIWTSTEVDGYAALSKMKSKYTGKANLMKALEARGATGFPVRTVVDEHGHSAQIDLVNAEKRSNPDSMFSLTGYSKSDNATLPGEIDMKELLKKVQSMSPEEREQMMERLKQQYQGSPH